MKTEKEIKEELEFRENLFKAQREKKFPDSDVFYNIGWVRALDWVLKK